MASSTTPDPAPATAAPSHGITVAQYRAALAALGLDPDMVVSVTLGGQYATVTTVRTQDGAPVVELGQVVTDTAHGPLLED